MISHSVKDLFCWLDVMNARNIIGEKTLTPYAPQPFCSAVGFWWSGQATTHFKAPFRIQVPQWSWSKFTLLLLSFYHFSHLHLLFPVLLCRSRKANLHFSVIDFDASLRNDIRIKRRHFLKVRAGSKQRKRMNTYDCTGLVSNFWSDKYSQMIARLCTNI